MKYLLLIFSVLTILTSCHTSKTASETPKHSKRDSVRRWTFNRVLKTNDLNIKYQKANEYYQKGKYNKAVEVYEQLLPYFKGMMQSEIVSYRYAMCNYYLGEYLMAAYLFEKFYNNYPTSDKAQKALFLSAYCYYKNSPRWSLDQTETHKAIEQFRVLMNKFPNSSIIDSANHIVDTLVRKLQYKDYKAAELYYNLEYYKASSIALDNDIKENPASPYNEKALFLIVKSDYLFAEGSIKKKQKERYEQTVSAALRYLNEYPQGLYLDEVNKILENSRKKIKQFEK